MDRREWELGNRKKIVLSCDDCRDFGGCIGLGELVVVGGVASKVDLANSHTSKDWIPATPHHDLLW